MLCKYCQSHFDFSADYSDAKKIIISHLRDRGADNLLLETLETDLNKYQSDRRQSDNVCPWLSLDSLPVKPSEDLREGLYAHRVGKFTVKGRVIKESARKGCDICARLVEVFSCSGWTPENYRVESLLVVDKITLLPLLLELTISLPGRFADYVGCVTFDIVERGHYVKPVPGVGSSISNSSIALDKLISSLSECVQMHDECQEEAGDGWIPTRLVDIRESKHSNTVRIVCREEVEADHPGGNTRYLTLSHIWGDQHFLTLTTKNIQELRSGFPVSRLPRTFIDAIAVTSQVGVQYLWIDFLCIIQDSRSDWSTEAGLMDKVYRNSYCTIAASLATGPREDLFCDRDLSLAGAFTVQFPTVPKITYFDLFADMQYWIFRHAPLYKRAWVFQESHLSPRTMHFSKFPAFECRKCFTCEVYQTPEPESATKLGFRLRHTTKSVFDKRTYAYSDWREMVQQYSLCGLTIPTDKLIALRSYYGGLWSEWWLPGLLWKVWTWDRNYQGQVRLKDRYIAPSWSWASVRAPVTPWNDRYTVITNRLVDLVTINTIPQNGDPFGELVGGELVLKGRLFRFSNFRAWVDDRDRGSRVYWDDFYGDYDSFLDMIDDFIDVEHDFKDKDTFFVPLAEYSGFLESEKESPIFGLVLGRAKGGMGEQGAFRRLALAAISDVDGSVRRSCFFVKDWKPPPWPEEELQQVVIV